MTDDKASALQRKISQIRRDGEERDAKRRAEKIGLPYLEMKKVSISIEAIRLIREEEAKTAKVAALQVRGKEVALLSFDPSTNEAKKIIEKLKTQKYEVKVFIGSLSSLNEAWAMYKFVSENVKEITGKVEIEKEQLGKLLQKLTTFQIVKQELEGVDYKKASTTELFEIILGGAIANRASDIHYEAEEEGARIRYRLDGILHDVMGNMPLSNYASLVSRIKLLSGLKINVRGEPQDGRFTIDLPEKDIEVRVSIIPSEFGETIVMRILDPDAIMVDLNSLGLREDDLAMVEEELKRPHGLILNTGPTGSGKTTTLYAFLGHIVTPEIKIITIEDPIEYRVQGIEQTQVNSEVGYTFAGGLRAIVRQDPDAILVGEIRDLETADIALQASLTGHMVFSTLHANDALGAVPRLIDLGVKPQTVGPALSLVIAQRLVRKLCENCKKKKELSPEEKGKIKNFLNKLPQRVKKIEVESATVFEAVGCEKCNSFGYKGRRGIFEFFKGGPELEEKIMKEASLGALRELASKQEMVTMQEDGVLKVLTGLTTFEEVESVTGPISW